MDFAVTGVPKATPPPGRGAVAPSTRARFVTVDGPRRDRSLIQTGRSK